MSELKSTLYSAIEQITSPKLTAFYQSSSCRLQAKSLQYINCFNARIDFQFLANPFSAFCIIYKRME